MNKFALNIIMALLVVSALTSCQKDGYKNDGGKADAFVNMTTYDFLKSRPIFDSLVRMIDHAGMKDIVNGDITFFATTNYGVADFMAIRKIQRGIQLGTENFSFPIDSLPAAEMRDSLKIYMYQGKINREQMTTTGTIHQNLLGQIEEVQFMIKLRRTRDYSAYLDHVDYVNFTKVRGSRDDQELNPNSIPQEKRDISVDCQTSGIITTTGIVHVLGGNHKLFFN